MNAFAQHFLHPPRLDTDERTYRARTFHQVAWATVGVALFFLGVLVVLQPETLLRRSASVAVLVGLVVALIALNRRGRTELASWLLIAGLIGLIGQRSYTSGGMSAPAMSGFVIIVLLAGLLLGMRGGIVVTAGCAAVGFAFALGEHRGLLPTSALDFTPLATWIYFCMWLGLALVVQRQVAVTLLRALHRAEAHLRSANERVKELRLLHETARLLQRERPAGDALFRELLGLIPTAWQHPGDCVARISYRQLDLRSPGWRTTPWIQSVDFETGDGRGRIEVAYLSAHPDAGDGTGPFIREEGMLLGSLAEMLVSHLELQKHRENLESLVATRTQQLSESYTELRNLEQLRDSLVHMVVHDMRSPLMVTMGRLQLLRMTLPVLDPAAEKHLASAEQAAQSVARMTNDLLDVHKLEEHKIELRKAPADLTRLAADVAAAFSGLEAGRSVVVEPGPAVEATCDASLIRRVIENLVSNGIKHTPEGAGLRIEVTGLPGRARVAVHDRGPGISAEARTRIFKKFGAIQARTDRTYHSIGLGLAFCKMAVEAHEGAIDVDPAAGGGSVFWFELPR